MDRDDAHKKASISTIAFTAGGVAFATGVVLWLTAPSNERSESARAPRINVSAGALAGLGAGLISVNGIWVMVPFIFPGGVPTRLHRRLFHVVSAWNAAIKSALGRLRFFRRFEEAVEACRF